MKSELPRGTARAVSTLHELSEVPPGFGVRRQSVAATALCIGPLPSPESSFPIMRLARRIQSGVALRFPPHSKTLARWQCRRANRKRQSAGAVHDVTARSKGSWSQCMRAFSNPLCFGRTAAKLIFPPGLGGTLQRSREKRTGQQNYSCCPRVSNEPVTAAMARRAGCE